MITIHQSPQRPIQPPNLSSTCERFALPLVLLAMLAGCGPTMESTSSNASSEVASNNAPSRGDRAVSREQLVSALNSRDFEAAISIFNDIKRESYQGPIIQTVRDLWSFRPVEYPHLDAQFISHPRIKLELADILLQYERNNQPSNVNPEYLIYAREMAMNSDPEIARQAILVLGVGAEDRDVGLLTNILMRDDSALSMAAANSLVRICSVSEASIIDLSKKVPALAARTQLLNSWRSMQSVRAYTCPT